LKINVDNNTSGDNLMKKIRKNGATFKNEKRSAVRILE
jgi:hypothetical protein